MSWEWRGASFKGEARGCLPGPGAPPTGCSLTRLASPTQDRVRHRPSPRGVLRRGDGERLQGGKVSGALLLRGKGMQPASPPPARQARPGLAWGLTTRLFPHSCPWSTPWSPPWAPKQGAPGSPSTGATSTWAPSSRSW